MPLPDLAATQNPYGQLVTFKVSDVLPPSAVYVGPNDQIFLQLLIPTLTAVQVTISYRLLRASDGQLVSTVVTQQITGPAFPFRLFIPPTEGYLLALMVQSNNVSRGQIYCRVFIDQGQLGAVGNLVGMLVQGYLSITDVLVYPGSVFESSLNGRGWLRTLSQGAVNQAPNVFTVPANVHWKIRAVNFTYSASATVASRQPYVAANDAGGNQLWFQLAPFTVPANNIGLMACAPGLTQSVNGTTASAGLGDDFILTPGFTISGNALAIIAGDQVGPMIITVEEFVGQ